MSDIRATQAPLSPAQLQTVREELIAMAKTSCEIQDTCNLSGVAIAFARNMEALCNISNALGKGTEWRNLHPIAIAWIDKMASLARIQSVTVHVQRSGYTETTLNRISWAHDWCNSASKGENLPMDNPYRPHDAADYALPE